MTISRNPRILIVTPEVTYLPNRMGSLASYLTAKAGGLADVSAALVNALFDQGADVHVAMPDYRAIFSGQMAPFLSKELQAIQNKMPGERIHLAEDRAFFTKTGSIPITGWKISKWRWPFSGKSSITSFPGFSPI